MELLGRESAFCSENVCLAAQSCNLCHTTTWLHCIKLTRKESAHCAGGEIGFLKRPGMVDEFDQQVSTSVDGKPIFLHPDCLTVCTQYHHTDRQHHQTDGQHHYVDKQHHHADRQHHHTDRQLYDLRLVCLQQACQEMGRFVVLQVPLCKLLRKLWQAWHTTAGHCSLA